MATTLTVKEAAEILSCVPETVRRMCRRGELKFIKLGESPRAPIRVIVNQPMITAALGEAGIGVLEGDSKAENEDEAFFA